MVVRHEENDELAEMERESYVNVTDDVVDDGLDERQGMTELNDGKLRVIVYEVKTILTFI